MNKRTFLKQAAVLSSIGFIPSPIWSNIKRNTLRTAHIGVGGMGGSDLRSISSHASVTVRALCDVDSDNLAEAHREHSEAATFQDYRRMFDQLGNEIDAVVVSTPDHTHAPASLLAMQMGKPVYCQKPLTRYVGEARAMRKRASQDRLVTQMGIQIHSHKAYRTAVILIQSGLIGKVKTVHAWSPKNWGFDGVIPEKTDPVPPNLAWNLWLGTARERPYQEKIFHPAMWRKILDYGCGTLGDMGVHIFDTPYAALELDVPKTITNECRQPNNFAHPEHNKVTYQFPGTKFTTEKLEWIWSDGVGAPEPHPDLKLPNQDELPEQGSMFVGEKGNLLLPHWDMPKLIVGGNYENVKWPELDEINHYHQFVDACLGNAVCSAPFSYAARLTEAILLGVLAGRFPNEKLHWDNKKAKFKESKANPLLKGVNRVF